MLNKSMLAAVVAVLSTYPQANAVYVCEDGAVFLEERINLAQNHSRENRFGAPLLVTREEVNALESVESEADAEAAEQAAKDAEAAAAEQAAKEAEAAAAEQAAKEAEAAAAEQAAKEAEAAAAEQAPKEAEAATATGKGKRGR